MTRPIAEQLAAAGLPPLPRTAWLAIDLDALAANLAAIRAAVAPGSVIMPVVKADAYGHGAVPVARSLEAAGADGLCVATLDEGLALRRAGIGIAIHVLYPIPPALVREAIAGDLTVAAGDPVALGRTLDAVRATRPEAAAPLAIEVEVETGLGRGGMTPASVPDAVRAIETTAGARFTGLWTHLQASEEPIRTAEQLDRFEAVAADLRAAGLPTGDRHVAATGGILTHVGPYDGVRPGLAIYGLAPDELDDASLDTDAAALAGGLRPVMSLHAQPVRVADVAVGDGVSYGPTWRASRPSRVATLPLGYGDGFGRIYSNRASALVRGQRVPLVGNVAMDALMVDVTDVAGSPVTIDDVVTLLGEQGSERITAGDLARMRTTNRWEVVTQMATRLPRVYHSASAPVDLWTLTERRG